MKKKLSIFQIIFTLISIFIINYLSKAGVNNSYLVLISLIIIQLILNLLNPLCAFVFCFIININIMDYSVYTWLRPVTILLIFSQFILKPKLLYQLFKNKKLKNIFYCSLLFSFFVLFLSLIIKTGFSINEIFKHFNILFGFSILLPAYYFTIKDGKNFFICMTIVAGGFLIIYYSNLIFNFDLFKIGNVDASIESNLTRFAGYDLRQFIIFYFFLIPTFLLTKAVSSIYKYFIISIGLLAFFVLVLGIYRLAMFYNFMGLLLSIFFIGKYLKIGQLFKRFIYFTIFIGFTLYIFNEYTVEFQKVFDGTFNYFSGKGEDKSADERFINQSPILLAYISNNFWTGCGLVESSLMLAKHMNGFVDIPILGSLAKFGFIGIFIYYMRFYFILKDKMKLTSSYFSSINEQDKLLLYILLTIRVYIISMITFRLFYISWELAFDWQQSEFGLLVGIFLALEHLIKQKEEQFYIKIHTNSTAQVLINKVII